jgi:hypothetical protein
MGINSKARKNVTNYNILLLFVCRDSSVGIVTGLWAGQLKNQGSFPGWLRDFFLLFSVHTGSEARLATLQCVPNAVSPEVKRKGLEADHAVSRVRMR